ncbi:CLUMA_CG002160, isoform A [Clunio marinus]|uniref:CLUMA_CG002160, isoform A n=1 Tax=Clunio marinus TaxID=568069 RepID=A0A1J1HK14_9DIPT|nr:CLUMA_CG002160, isoform A [Clunio marinus]
MEPLLKHLIYRRNGLNKVFCDASLEGYHEFDDIDDPSDNFIPTHDPFSLDPFFDPNVNQNVTALVGKSAYLNCVVKNLGNKTVSWIRHRDLHILTVSTYTYTTDLRFQTTHHRTTDEWTLQIKWVQKRDAGSYDCQVSSQPIKSYSVDLNVIVPTAFILGGPEYYISKGSTINLTCIVKFSPDAPSHTFWHFKDKVLSFETEPRLSQFTENGETFTNYLLIRDVNVKDTGKYACAPSNAEPAFIMVHVVSGENPEAYSSSSKLSSCCSPYTIFSLTLSLHLLCNRTYSLFRAKIHFKYHSKIANLVELRNEPMLSVENVVN